MNVEQRRAAFRRVENVAGTHDGTKLLQCYSDTSREGIYEQGLRMSKAICKNMLLDATTQHHTWQRTDNSSSLVYS